MAKYPEVQRKAQAEIDQVIGSSRLPDFEDRPALPYIEAIYREVMRWSQSLPLGVPHAVTEDDHYNGYFIPKGIYSVFSVSNLLSDIFSCHQEPLFLEIYGSYACLFLLLRWKNIHILQGYEPRRRCIPRTFCFQTRTIFRRTRQVEQ